jgi:hypothetical protein|tara:strand:- start:617 stop:868 length:252 start_codon:yes stop_codon:yes gene_type:complete
MNIFKLTLQFAKEAAKYIAEGAPNVSPEQYEERLKACQSCEHRVEGTHNDSCGLCGCKIAVKAKWQTTDCPDKPSRWPEIKKK